jgi:hypothetical protein
MEKYILTSKEEKGKITFYTYESGSNKISFHFHPKKSFVFVLDNVVNLTPKKCDLVLNQFVRNGMAQHEFRGGFNEAIKVLYITEPNLKPNSLKLVENPKF